MCNRMVKFISESNIFPPSTFCFLLPIIPSASIYFLSVTVTCIQFNPVNDSYFISGSLDAKVRIWSIPDRQVVDWTDMHEMVTVACYTPDGQSALVGSYKGSCHLYNASVCPRKFIRGTYHIC
ncbi:putative WD repeat-containing protein [Arachis hypogaea]|nr:putative WD repeat-containing protein [Arachis hypogaea]